MNPTSQERLPKLSVLMVTYNHELFIAQAIESVLMQETDFPVELVIGEDCSTDGTREIVKRYAVLHPEIIRPVLHEKNVGMSNNFESIRKSSRGSYIAFLDGDDYWTSPRKLQSQVDFLDSHPDHAMCATRFWNVQDDNPTGTPIPSPIEKESGSLEDILRWNYILTCTVVYRAALIQEIPPPFMKIRNADMALWTMLAERGRVGYINEIMAAYRMHGGGIWVGASMENKISSLEYTIDTIHAYLGNRHPRLHRESLCIRYAEFAACYSQIGDYANARRRLGMAFLKSPATFFTLPNARRCLVEQFMFHVLHPLRNARIWCAGKYYKMRIRAGAHRRRWWKAATGRPHSANPGTRE
jgi:glycosyltransferase involved in cell wall biosynthesis